MHSHHRMRLRAAFGATLAAALFVASWTSGVPAHEGHDHSDEPAAGSVVGSPRVVAQSERYQFVGIVEGEVLVVYLDRADDNAPVTGAAIEVSIDGAPFKAEPLAKTGTYEVTAPVLRKPGSYEILVTLSEGDVSDLLIGTLKIPQSAGQAGSTTEGWFADKTAAAVAGTLILAAVVASAAALTRRRRSAVPSILALALVAGFVLVVPAWAHDGHDHGADLSASTGNSPFRRPDGTLFVPKPTQRLLELKTRVVKVESQRRTVRFHGRIIASPNHSGVVQSTIQGRYEAPEGGVPVLGTRVKAGDLLGKVAPSFQSIDSSDMAQTLGTLDQEISLNRRKLARLETLLATNTVSRASVEDIRILLEGLETRRKELLAARTRPEALRAPVDGVIAALRVVSGQVVTPSDQLFQIVDPAHLLVEALVFDQLDPDAVAEATASVAGGTGQIRLKFLGRSRALQQQYATLHFEILDAGVPLNVGTPAMVIASAGEMVTGMLLPRSALAQAPNGQTVVFAHKEPEVFVPRAVRVEPFDGDSVLVTGGIAPGEKIVVQNAPLLNQVR